MIKIFIVLLAFIVVGVVVAALSMHKAYRPTDDDWFHANWEDDAL